MGLRFHRRAQRPVRAGGGARRGWAVGDMHLAGPHLARSHRAPAPRTSACCGGCGHAGERAAPGDGRGRGLGRQRLRIAPARRSADHAAEFDSPRYARVRPSPQGQQRRVVGRGRRAVPAPARRRVRAQRRGGAAQCAARDQARARICVWLPRQGLSRQSFLHSLRSVCAAGYCRPSQAGALCADSSALAGEVAYFVAATGVVYSPESHTQRFFTEHDDDILSMAQHPSEPIMATGQTDPTVRAVAAAMLEALGGSTARV